ncbi:LemA family protein [Halosimplex sp. TS25]|uniref:LemA family protein n=1 Tax=Halosimplex rarum TaxID=3396619 RepID=UPI0039EB572F
MSLFVPVVGAFAVALVAWSALRYAKRAHDHLVDARENCEAAWSNVEVLLQRRHDEVGNLVELAGEYMSMERDVLAGIVEARDSAIEANSPEEAALAEAEIRDSIQEFYSIADEYPELRTDEKFEDVRDALQNVEQRLENRREYYNDAVRRYNALLEKVPERYVAARRGYEPREPFEATEAARGEFSVRERLEAE